MQSSSHENIRNTNPKDIFLRNATIALLNVFNKQVFIETVRNDIVEKHSIPFFYNFGGSAGFMKDFFMELPTDCNYPNYAEGNYEQLPRGIITLTGFSIKTADSTNPFVRGSFSQETRDINDQKQHKTYSARLRVLPMSLSYSIKVESDNINKTFKIIEKLFEMYHKNIVDYFQFRGTRIPVQITFPDTGTLEKSYNFTYTDSTNVNTTFAVNVETYFPSFDDHTVRYKGNTIQQINQRVRQIGSNELMTETWTDYDDLPAQDPILPDNYS
jgi:hypothetical protein